MENKTTELQNKKNTAAIFSDIRQQVEDGKGFLSVCLENRKQKKRSAARKSIDDLEYALKLLGQKPTKEEYGKKERSFYWKKAIYSSNARRTTISICTSTDFAKP